MGQIVNKLNLNRVPQLVDNNSLIFAKNVRLSANGFSPDYGFDEIGEPPFKEGDAYRLVGVIPYNTKFYTFWHQDATATSSAKSAIWEYDEHEINPWTEIISAWKWSNGEIDGICNVNLRGDILLTITEQTEGVPLKTINITEHKKNIDVNTLDESYYTQAPIIPLYNLNLAGKYNNTIPAGVYQFYIRYELYKDCYTNWFPASKELFSGYQKTMKTQQGGLKYIDTHSDASNSFILAVDKIYKPNTTFKSFQLGFIISHDDEVYARAYKHYNIDTETIYFDYDTEYIEEIDLRDILAPTYDLYNVGNITEFKNKLYISNYSESDSNPKSIDIDNFVNGISINLGYQENAFSQKFNDNTPITVTYVNGIPYLEAINGDNINSIVETLLSRHTDMFDDINVVPSFATDSENHIEMHFSKSVEVLHENINADPEIIVDDYYHILDEAGTTVDEHTITNVLTYLSGRSNSININNGAFRPTNSVGPSGHYTITFETLVGNTVYKSTIIIYFYCNVANIVLEQSVDNEYTLIPYQKYKFYVHFVTNKGEITNGYPLNNNVAIEALENTNKPNSAIYPIFAFSQELPSRFKACFISILHTDNIVATVFNIHNTTTNGTKTIGDCIELDSILYSALANLTCRIGNSNYLFDYRASADNELYMTFGASGKCVFRDNISDEILEANGNKGYLIMPYNVNPEYAQLIKCTPWIMPTEGFTYDEYNNLNLVGYLGQVKKPLDNLDIYISGQDIYRKTVVPSQSSGEVLHIDILQPVNGEYEEYNLLDSNTYVVYSNFNLNYLALRTAVSEQIVSKKINDTDKRYVLYAIQSLNLSEVYELPSMYKSYVRSTYNVIDNNSIVTFTNTIRSSRLEGDEDKLYLYKFLATDYYNVPTDKGIIINLVAVGDNILVHTQDSIYKFTGYNSLTAAGGEDVQMKESEPFDTGIQELFGSEFGYAGLQNKKHQVLSEMGYTFYDSDGQRIYYYTGNANIKVISDDVSKLFKYKPLKDIYFADDYYNNRVFVCLDFGDNKYATLTYDFTAKCFISLHDFHFDWAFKTKTKCYFITPERNNIYKVSDTNITDYPSEFSFKDKLYPTGDNKECIIDVIYNEEFETIKTLNAISWVCNKVKDFLEEANNATEDMLVAEEWFDPKHSYKGEVLRIYSDSVKTPAIDISDKTNEHSIKQVASYDRPRYNLGKWTFNYFRNILNRDEDPTHPRVFGEQDTLLYGKYFVARFIFNRTTNFKIEDVTFEISNDYNV